MADIGPGPVTPIEAFGGGPAPWRGRDPRERQLRPSKARPSAI